MNGLDIAALLLRLVVGGAASAIFRPGEGYGYVLMITLVACAIAAFGGGTWSLDNAVGFSFDGWRGLALGAGAGGAGGALLLAPSWRPARIGERSKAPLSSHTR
jgi:hypothetical protein